MKRVVAVDVGSVSTSNFGWAAFDLATRDTPATLPVSGCSPDGVVGDVVEALRCRKQVALGFEAPLVLPVPDDWRDLGKGRVGEPNRAWSAAAGASVMGTGIVQLAWICARINALTGGVSATTQLDRWSADVPLFIWEAFVSGSAKTDVSETGHMTDAIAAARAFDDRVVLGLLPPDVHVGDHRPLNLAAVGAVHGGLRLNLDELDAPVLIVKAQPPMPSAR